MPVASLLIAGFLGFGLGPDVLDLPYPEPQEMVRVGGADPAGELATPGIAEAIATYARPHAKGGRIEVTSVKVEGKRASAVLTTPERSERVDLIQSGKEWRVVPPGAASD